MKPQTVPWLIYRRVPMICCQRVLHCQCIVLVHFHLSAVIRTNCVFAVTVLYLLLNMHRRTVDQLARRISRLTPLVYHLCRSELSHFNYHP